MIRPYALSDRVACVKLVDVNWGHKVASRFLTELNHAYNSTMRWPPQYYVYELEGEVVAFGGIIQSWVMRGVWDFIWVNVHPDYQKRGIGKHLTAYRIDEVRRQGGAVINLVTQKTSFFEHFGFRDAFRYRGDWHLMTLQLRELRL